MRRLALLATVLMGGIKKAWSLSYDGTTSKATCGSNLDNLHDAELTVDLWLQNTAAASNRMIIDKGILGSVGWGIYFDVSGRATFTVTCATTSPSVSTANNSLEDGKWHHVTAYFNDAGDRKCYIALDGVWRPASGAAAGAIVSDAAKNLTLGVDAHSFASWFWQGYFGWVRLSNNDRFSHGTNFTTPGRLTPPSSDANTLELWKVNQGSGNAIATITTPGNDGVLTNVTWAKL